MPRWLRIAAVVLLALVALALLGWRHLTAREAPPAVSEYRLDLAEIRRLAAAPPGPRPLRVASELVAESTLPRAAVFAGASFEPHPMVHPVFQIVFPDGFLLVDAGFGEETLAAMGGGTFHAGAFGRVQEALGRARGVVVTHEHLDHIGGLAVHEPADELVGRLRLTREQLANEERLDEVSFPEPLREALEPLVYERLHALAPGVVLVKAPGHTPGTQMVYVGLRDGRELLLLGDVAWHLDQIRELHYRPRLVTDLYLGEDREAVLHQFRALHDLARAEPELTLVVSHDRDQRARLLASGRIADGFEGL